MSGLISQLRTCTHVHVRMFMCTYMYMYMNVHRVHVQIDNSNEVAPEHVVSVFRGSIPKTVISAYGIPLVKPCAYASDYVKLCASANQ